MIAAPYSSADFMHGPIAIVEAGFPILAIAPSGPTLEGVRELLEAASARGADVTVISDAAGLPGRRIHLQAVPEWLSPLAARSYPASRARPHRTGHAFRWPEHSKSYAAF